MVALLRLFGALVIVGSLCASGFRTPRRFGDAVRNVIDGIKPGHVLLLQVVYGVAFTFGEHRYEDVCPGNLLTARGLDVNRGSLQHPLKARGRLCIVTVGGDEVAELIIDMVQNLAAQSTEIDTASTQ